MKIINEDYTVGICSKCKKQMILHCNGKCKYCNFEEDVKGESDVGTKVKNKQMDKKDGIIHGISKTTGWY